MPDLQITDQLDKPLESIKIDLAQPSSLVKYLQTQALHLAVFPDLLARKDKILTEAATKPIQFQARAQHQFQLGDPNPEIDITPEAQATIRVNASPGTNLFENDPFLAPAAVPEQTGYVSIGFEGSFDTAGSGAKGSLTFGFDATSSVSLEYLKAFPLGGTGEPTLGEALGQTMSSYVIPATIPDLDSLAVNDIATVSGQGSLQISGGVSFTASPNPLASVDLPLGVGSIAVKAGATAALSASFAISGSYQVRARRKDADTVELSFLRKHGSSWTADLSVSGGVAANLGKTDLIATILGAISTDPTGDKSLLADLKPEEVQTLFTAIKSGLNHTFQASIDAALSGTAEDQAAFQYDVQPSRLSPAASDAVRKALHGDLSLLTAMEEAIEPGGILAPGVRLLNSILTKTRQRGVTLKINLLGILNFLTVSELIRNSEIVTDAVTGDVTIKETVTGNRISAIVEPLARDEALRKAMFDSVLATTTYRAGKAVVLPDLNCQQMHFMFHRNTNRQILGDYLNGFIALNLLQAPDQAGILSQAIDGGPSSCVLRTWFGDRDCRAMFFDAAGQLHPIGYYFEIGRRAMQALLDPRNQPNDGLRYRIVDDPLWPKALDIGANVNLGPLVGLSTDDPRVSILIGDVLVIRQWAAAMVDAGALVQDMRAFVGDADPATLFQSSEFRKKRENLQKKLAAMVKASKTRFDEPWGMVCLFRAAGSPPTAYGKTTAGSLIVERGSQPTLAAAITG